VVHIFKLKTHNIQRRHINAFSFLFGLYVSTASRDSEQLALCQMSQNESYLPVYKAECAHQVSARLQFDVLVVLWTDLAQLERRTHLAVDFILLLGHLDVVLRHVGDQWRQVGVRVLTIRVHVAAVTPSPPVLCSSSSAFFSYLFSKEHLATRRVAVYLETHCNIGSKTMTQLFTYLLVHKLFSSRIRRYLVSLACDWVMPATALSVVLLTFSFQFSLLLFIISLTRPHQSHIYGSGPQQHCSVLLDNIGQRTLPKIWAFWCAAYSRGESLWIILALKLETRHRIGKPFGCEFSAIVTNAKLWRPEVARHGNYVSHFCVLFLEERPLSNCRYCENRAQNLPGPAPTFPHLAHVPCSRSHPNR